MQKFKLETEFTSVDDRLAEGDLKIDVAASTPFIASCLFHIIDENGKKDRKAVEIATTRCYKKVLDL